MFFHIKQGNKGGKLVVQILLLKGMLGNVGLKKKSTFFNKIKMCFDFIKNCLYFCKKIITMLPCNCPSCQSQLKVRSLKCDACETEVFGLYELPALARLSPEDQQFVMQFVKCSGSIKEMAKFLNLSYPTVRNLLDDIIERVKN